MTYDHRTDYIPRSGVNLSRLKEKLAPLMTGPCAIPITTENRALIEFMVGASLIEPHEIIFTEPCDNKLPHNKRYTADSDWDNYNAVGSFIWSDAFTDA